jgi:hypothetical protein
MFGNMNSLVMFNQRILDEGNFPASVVLVLATRSPETDLCTAAGLKADSCMSVASGCVES